MKFMCQWSAALNSGDGHRSAGRVPRYTIEHLQLVLSITTSNLYHYNIINYEIVSSLSLILLKRTSSNSSSDANRFCELL